MSMPKRQWLIQSPSAVNLTMLMSADRDEPGAAEYIRADVVDEMIKDACIERHVRHGMGLMSWLGKLVGGGVGEVAGALGTAAKDIEDVFTTSDREQLSQYEAETERLKVQAAATQGQLAVNKVEARHSSVFVAGWRPGVGWICAAAMAYHFIAYPIFGPFVEKFTGTALVDLAWQELSVVLMGMLGFGGLRAFEKVKGVAREKVRK